MEQLTAALQREQSLLELLLFKLVETRLLLAAGEVRFVPDSAREVRHARQRACNADLGRAAVVGGLRETRGDALAPTLRGLAAEAGEPWAGMLRDHHDALCGLVAEIELAAHHNAQAACEGLLRVQGALPTATSSLSHIPSLRDAHDPTLSLVADHSAYRSVLGSADSLRMPALLAFLR